MKSLNLAINKKMVLGIVCMVLTCSSAWAATYYVSTSGNDSNPGTQSQPWRTIGKSARTMVAGDTVQVEAGTYNETVTPANSGSAGNYITYNANGVVKIQQVLILSKNYIKIIGFQNLPESFTPNYNYQHVIVVQGAASYNIIQNNTISIPNTTACTYEYGAIRATGSYNTVTSNTLSGNCYQPMINIGGDNNTYSNNIMSHSLTDMFQGVGATNATISGNTMTDFVILGMHNDCFQVFDVGGAPTRDLLIQNNICGNSNPASPADQPCNMSLDGGTSSGVVFRNNIFYNFSGQCGAGIPGTKFYNNIFWRVGTAHNQAITFPEISGLEVKNNFFIGCGSSTANTDYGTGYAGRSATSAGASHNYYARDPAWSNPWGPVPFYVEREPNMVNGGNPLFTNHTTYDFTIQATSPAKDKGMTITSFALDKNGVSRAQGPAWDIGPFEFFSSSVLPPTGLKIVNQ